MNADGTNQIQLTTNFGDFDPAWSPDGTKLVFVRQENSQTDLYTINVNGTGETNFTNTPDVTEESPDWQPLHPGYARPKGATKMTLKFVPAYRALLSSPNAIHGPPLVVGSCCPPRAGVGLPHRRDAGLERRCRQLRRLRHLEGDLQPACAQPDTALHRSQATRVTSEFQVSFTDVRQKPTPARLRGRARSQGDAPDHRPLERPLRRAARSPGPPPTCPSASPSRARRPPTAAIGIELLGDDHERQRCPARHCQGGQALGLGARLASSSTTAGQTATPTPPPATRCSPCRGSSPRRRSPDPPTRLADSVNRSLDVCRGLTGRIDSPNSRGSHMRERGC